MNGRVYDYNLGRFLSVDPFIQSPGNSQSMNPYSYIMNNPLAGTDPSGYKAEEETVTKTERVAVTGSRIKRKVTKSVTKHSDGSVTGSVTSNGKTTNFTLGAKGWSQAPSDIGSQASIAKGSKSNEVTESEMMADPTAFIGNTPRASKEEQFNNNNDVNNAGKKLKAKTALSDDDVESTAEQRKFVIRIAEKVGKALGKFNKKSRIDAELLLAVKQQSDGTFVILESILVGATGGEVSMPTAADFFVHWHNKGFAFVPDQGDISSVLTQNKSMFTVAWSKRGRCCTSFEVGRQNKLFKYRPFKSDSVGKWTDRYRKNDWNGDK